MASVLQQSATVVNTWKAASIAVDALQQAQMAIMEDDEIGKSLRDSVSLLGGLLSPLSNLEQTSGFDWFFVGVTIGSVKLFHWNAANGEVTDITKRAEIQELPGSLAAVSAGGLGAAVGSQPDMASLRLVSKKCSEDDMFLVLSPTMHANLDPITLGKTPEDCGLTESNWSDVPTATFLKVRNDFRSLQLQTLLSEVKERSPRAFQKRLLQHARHISAKLREYADTVQSLPSPQDFKLMPGKLGTANCIVVSVSALPMPSRAELAARKQLAMGTVFRSMLRRRKNFTSPAPASAKGASDKF